MPPHFPNEVLLGITRILRYPKTINKRTNGPDYATLSNLCRVSKGFQQVAEPLLYESISLSHDGLSAFVVTVERKPCLEGYVKELSIPSEGLTGLTRLWLRKRLEERQDSAEHISFKRAIQLALDVFKIWPSADPETIYLLLLTMLLPEVEVLHCAPNMCPMQCIANVDHPGPFPRLREVHIEGSEPDIMGFMDSTPASLCEPFLPPTVQIFDGFGVDWLAPIKWRGTERMALKTVRLRSSLCNGTGVADLLSHCPDLESLSLEWSNEGLNRFEGDNDFPYYDEIGEALRQYGKNIQELELDCLEENYYNCDYLRTVEELEEERIGSLRELMRLRTLRLPLDLLLGKDDWIPHLEEEDHETGPQMPTLTLSDVLPRSLETLELMSCPWNGIEHLHTQIHDLLATGHMASLRSISVERHQGGFQCDIAHLGWNASIIEHRFTSLNNLLITKKYCSRVAQELDGPP